MRSRILIVLMSVIGLFAFSGSGPGDKKDEVLSEVLLNTLQLGHYTKQSIDDEFSETAYNAYLDNLDNYKRFLTKSDVESLSKYKYKIDDQLKAGEYEFFDESTKLIEQRIKEAESYYGEILSKPFDLEQSESIQLDPEKIRYASSKKELKDNWRKYLKFQTVSRLNELMNQQEDPEGEDQETKSFEELEAEAREAVRTSQENWFERLNQLDENDRKSMYINSVLSTYDPHTTYLPPKAKEDFDIAISGQLEGIGARLIQKDGNIKVQEIVAGSASWKQGDLEAGDIILKVAQGDDEPVDVVHMRLDDAVQLIRGKKGSEVRLTVKKIDGTIKVIPIIRDIVILEETYAKSAVIENGKKVGYIRLPSFYADFNGTGGRSSSDDVEKAINELKKENIEGLVLDLRNNGGGSLMEVVKMAGLFIEKGPVVQVKTSMGELEVLEDTDSDVEYDGPLTILVNAYSASASEILAAAMQDYDRAVVIGSPSTYGKGTVQRMYDLDRFVPVGLDDVKPLGALKLTVQKFYRVDGGATQLKGVVPDIILPDQFKYLDVGEKELDYAMEWDEIMPAKYDSRYDIDNLSTVVANSRNRADVSEVFDLIDENAVRLKKNSEITEYPLNFQEYRSQQEKLQEEAEKFKDVLKKDIPGMTVVSTKNPANDDSAAIARVEKFTGEIKKDVYVKEAVEVIKDIQMD